MRDSFQRILNIQQGEGRLVFLLFAEIFLLGIGFNFVETSVFPLFLSEFSSANLPYIYIINAIVVALVTTFYIRLGRYLSFGRQLIFLQVLLIALPFGFWLALVSGGGRTVIFGLPILFQIVVNLGQMAFWTMTGRLLNLRQSKRLFGVIGAGLWVAIVLTGFLIPLIVGAIGTVNLLLLSALGMVAALMLLVYITRHYRAALEPAVGPAMTSVTKRAGDRGSLRNPYVLLILSLTVAAWLSFFFVDNIFFNRASAQFPTQEAMSSFMGLYLAALGIFTLFNNLFLVGFVVNRFGVRVALSVLPVSLLIVTIFFSAFGTIGGILPLLFWLATLNRVLDLGLFFSVDQSAQAILYQPLPLEERTRIQTIDNGIVQMSAVALAGGLLILLNRVLNANVVQLSYVLLVVIVVWLVVVWLVARQYPHQLMNALSRRRLSGVNLVLNDNVTIAVLKKALANPRPGAALYALGLLAGSQPEMIESLLTELLAHPAAQVRREALRQMELLRPEGVASSVKEAAASDPDATVREAAWRALAAVGGPALDATLMAQLHNPDHHARDGALTGLRLYGQGKARLAANATLAEVAASAAPPDRLAAITILGNSFETGDCDLLAGLLGDADNAVRRNALLVAGRTGCPDLWPGILSAVNSKGARQAAIHALATIGEAVLPLIAVEMNRPGQSRDVSISLARACGRIGGPLARDILFDQLNHPDDQVRSELLTALSAAEFQALSAGESENVRRQIRAEVDHAIWMVTGLRDCAGQDGLQFLNRVLADQFNEALNRIYLLLSFIADRQSMLQVRESLLPGKGKRVSEAKRSYAIEVLELRLPSDLKKLVIPLSDTLSPAALLRKLDSSATQATMRPEKRVVALLAGDGYVNRWLLASELHAAGQIQCRDSDVDALLRRYVRSADPLLRETAAWTAARLGDVSFIPPGNGEKSMLTTIEKVIILKDVDLFAETPDELLAEVGELLAEVEIAAGQPVFTKGEAGDCLYIVVSGRVRVHDSALTINMLGESEVFGEMALLDPETRMASVTAETDSLLLRLDQESFYELMDTRSEVARGIIRVLSSRLRSRVQEIATLRNEPGAAGQLTGAEL